MTWWLLLSACPTLVMLLLLLLLLMLLPGDPALPPAEPSMWCPGMGNNPCPPEPPPPAAIKTRDPLSTVLPFLWISPCVARTLSSIMVRVRLGVYCRIVLSTSWSGERHCNKCRFDSWSDFVIPTSASFSLIIVVHSKYLSGFSPGTIAALMYSLRYDLFIQVVARHIHAEDLCYG